MELDQHISDSWQNMTIRSFKKVSGLLFYIYFVCLSYVHLYLKCIKPVTGTGREINKIFQSQSILHGWIQMS